MTKALTYVEIDIPPFAQQAVIPELYFLRASFAGATNQTFTHQQPMLFPAQGMIDGGLLPFDLGAGTIGIGSSTLQGRPSSGNVGAYFNVIPRTKALAYQCRLSATNTSGQVLLGPYLSVSTNGAFGDPDGAIAHSRGLVDLLSSQIAYCTDGTSPLANVGSYTGGAALELLWLTGGWSSAGAPWDGVSDFSTFLYGKSLYQWSGSSWTLLARDVNVKPHSVYGGNGPDHDFGFGIDFGANADVSHIIVKDQDYKAALIPTFVLTSPGVSGSTQANGTADQILEIKLTRPTAASQTLEVGFRRVDHDNRWIIRIDDAGTMAIIERVSASEFTRASVGGAVPAGSSTIHIVMQGTTITAWNQTFVSSCSYGSASNFSTATGVTVANLGTGSSISHITSHPRTGYTSVFTQCADHPLTNGRNAAGNSPAAPTKVLTLVGDSLLDGNTNGLHRDNVAICMQSMLGGTWDGTTSTGNRWKVNDRSVGGTGISDIVSDLTATMNTFSSSNARNILLIHSGTKELVNTPSNPAAAVSAMQSYIASVNANAASNNKVVHILLHSIIDRKEFPAGAAQFAIDRASYNSTMQTWAATQDNVTWVNLDSDARLTNSFDTRYFRFNSNSPPDESPGVHVNYWGEGLIARQDFDAINLLEATENLPTDQTFRFAKDTLYLPANIDAIPSINEVKITPATISLGQNLGQRASVEVLFKDHKHIFAAESFDSGTFWGKFRARYGLKLRGFPLRVINGTVGTSLEGMETRHFIIESTDGPSTSGEYRIIAKDIIKFADGDRAQAPPLSTGFLAADITNTQTNITLSPAGSGNASYLGAGYVAIGGKEIVRYNRLGIDSFDVLLVHADGNSPGSIIDALSTPHTIFPAGNVTASATQSKFGGSSISFDGAGDFFNLDGSSEFAFGTGDFCVDFWARFNSVASTQTLYDSRPTATNGNYLTIYFASSGTKIRVMINSADRITGSTNIVINTWYHIAVTREGSAMKLFVNGVQDGSDTNSTSLLNGAARPTIGSDGTSGGTNFNGFMDELRVSKGAPRFTSTPFSVPTVPYSAAGSGDMLSIMRAQYNTLAVDHKAGDRVQLCVEYLGKDVADIIYDLLVTYAGIDPSFITLSNWQTETATYLSTIYSALIAEPTSVNTLVSELIEQASLAMWWDDISQQIRFQVIRSVATTADVFDSDNTMMGSLEVQEQPSKRISQVYTYFNKINPLVKEDQIDNYGSSVFSADMESELDYGSASIKKIFSRWIPVGGRSVAQSVNDILLARFVTPPRGIKFNVMRYAGNVPTLGQGYQIKGWPFQDVTGAADSVPAQIIRLNPRADFFEVEVEEVFAGADISPSSPDNHIILIDSNTLNVNLRSVHDSLYAPATSGVTVTCTILSGIIVGSSSAAVPAFDVGSWAAGVIVHLNVLGRIEGKGGDGGAGGRDHFGGSPGSAGGSALYVRYNIVLTDASGQIWGGGGGGGGGAGGSLAGGGGGGGAAGSTPGIGAVSNGNGDTGGSGTTELGGIGGNEGPTGGGTAGGKGGAGGGPGLSGTNGVSTGSGSGGTAGTNGKAIDGISFVTTGVGGAGDRRGGTV